jgi:hypothetical protein
MTSSEDKAQKRREFLKNLAMGLMKPHMENRALIKNLPVHIRCFLAKYKPQEEEDTAEPPPKLRKRCRLCGRMKNRDNDEVCFFAMILSAENIQIGKCSVIHVYILQRMKNKKSTGELIQVYFQRILIS